MKRSNRLRDVAILAAMTSLFFVSPALSLASSPVHDNQPSPFYANLPAEVRAGLQKIQEGGGHEYALQPPV